MKVFLSWMGTEVKDPKAGIGILAHTDWNTWGAMRGIWCTDINNDGTKIAYQVNIYKLWL